MTYLTKANRHDSTLWCFSFAPSPDQFPHMGHLLCPVLLQMFIPDGRTIGHGDPDVYGISSRMNISQQLSWLWRVEPVDGTRLKPSSQSLLVSCPKKQESKVKQVGRPATDSRMEVFGLQHLLNAYFSRGSKRMVCLINFVG